MVDGRSFPGKTKNEAKQIFKETECSHCPVIVLNARKNVLFRHVPSSMSKKILKIIFAIKLSLFRFFQFPIKTVIS